MKSLLGFFGLAAIAHSDLSSAAAFTALPVAKKNAAFLWSESNERIELVGVKESFLSKFIKDDEKVKRRHYCVAGPAGETETRRQWIERTLAAALAATTTAAKLCPSSASADTFDSFLVSATGQSLSRSSVRSSLCDPTVSSFRRGSRVVHIVGTAHISSMSAKLAGNVVKEVKPDAVYVELDLRRIGRAFRKGQPIAGVQIAYQDDRGLKVGTISSRPAGPLSILGRMLKKASDLVGSPIQSMYDKLEKEGFVAGEEVSECKEIIKIWAP